MDPPYTVLGLFFVLGPQHRDNRAPHPLREGSQGQVQADSLRSQIRQGGLLAEKYRFNRTTSRKRTYVIVEKLKLYKVRARILYQSRTAPSIQNSDYSAVWIHVLQLPQESKNGNLEMLFIFLNFFCQEVNPLVVTKSSIMVGLGETDEEIEQ